MNTAVPDNKRYTEERLWCWRCKGYTKHEVLEDYNSTKITAKCIICEKKQ